MDRNGKVVVPAPPIVVALRKESVDRNIQYSCRPVQGYVALRKESVDRNINLQFWSPPLQQSLSARRAWIETFIRREISLMRPVALRKESVDRNVFIAFGDGAHGTTVALRKESVDRNIGAS